MSFRVSSTKHTAVGRWWRTVIGSYFSVASPEYKRRTGTWRCPAYRICSSFGVQQSAGAAPCSPTPANRRSSDHGEQAQLGPRQAGAVSSTSSPARGAVQTSAFSPTYRRGSALGVQVWRSPRRTGCSPYTARRTARRYTGSRRRSKVAIDQGKEAHVWARVPKTRISGPYGARTLSLPVHLLLEIRCVGPQQRELTPTHIASKR
jgi:hypothetical protein